MYSKKTKKLVIAALMAAMTCIATMIIQFPSPVGYIHIGDGIVLVSGMILGPIYGGAAAGIGSMLADLLSGYTSFALATFIIKALAAITAHHIYQLLSRHFNNKKNRIISVIVASVGGGIIVTSGYFIFEGYIMGYGVATAAAGILFNMVQNIFGIILSIILMPILIRLPEIKSVMNLEN
ncbi:ECF transporter S component [Anaerocolumna aminovalerica]|uniref:Uncharacterized membrane protein n=1 Tax=Anaerocolumna aminovalerica TaxID=1527 RepID=A0A1I5GN74_9FIRM|nr:ECF transporter S component [Anaerocolumna aminovalerica]MBU5333199.1 ECF transporter S component [Anaerocolumna aminovalerica]SFO37413.1 Uncharacterized membrane protein [Anaerocolumna aminovalerica]